MLRQIVVLTLAAAALAQPAQNGGGSPCDGPADGSMADAFLSDGQKCKDKGLTEDTVDFRKCLLEQRGLLDANGAVKLDDLKTSMKDMLDQSGMPDFFKQGILDAEAECDAPLKNNYDLKASMDCWGDFCEKAWQENKCKPVGPSDTSIIDQFLADKQGCLDEGNVENSKEFKKCLLGKVGMLDDTGAVKVDELKQGLKELLEAQNMDEDIKNAVMEAEKECDKPLVEEYDLPATFECWQNFCMKMTA